MIEKLKELGKGIKVNIGFDITLSGDISLVLYFSFKKIVKNVMIFDNDAYSFLEKVYDEYYK